MINGWPKLFALATTWALSCLLAFCLGKSLGLIDGSRDANQTAATHMADLADVYHRALDNPQPVQPPATQPTAGDVDLE